MVENPATSSPGLAFLLATVAAYGDPGYLDYWQGLKDNGVTVVDGWERAYFGEFSGAGGGDGTHPLVVSYATSPVAEVYYADPPIATAPTGVLTDTCYAQVEFAGVLAGTDHPEAAQAFIDFLLSKPFQEDIPLRMFVSPVSSEAKPPKVFRQFAVPVSSPYSLTARPGGSAPRGLGRRLGRRHGKVSRRARIALIAIPVAFLVVWFVYPLGAIVWRTLGKTRARSGGCWASARAAGDLVHDVAGGAVHGRDIDRRAADRLRRLEVRVRGAAGLQCRAARALRAPHDRRWNGVHRMGGVGRRDRRGARLLQRRRGGASGGRGVGVDRTRC